MRDIDIINGRQHDYRGSDLSYASENLNLWLRPAVRGTRTYKLGVLLQTD